MSEKIGSVNCYTCERCRHKEYVMLLNTGTTWFSDRCACMNLKYSGMYRLHRPMQITIDSVFYRPKSILGMDKPIVEHILQGGLIKASLDGNSIEVLYPDFDPCDDGWTEYVFEHYGEKV